MVSSIPESIDLQGCKILIVEDNPFNQKVVERFLRNWKGHTTIVESGEDAIEELKKKEQDIVLMDLQMPQMDGYKTAELIRSLEGDYFQQIPIIAMSADALGEVKDRVMASGMNDYVSKPFDPSDLMAKLIRYKKDV